MIPACLREVVRRGADNAGQALAEFRKFFTDEGIAGSCWSAPLAKLGLARAEGMTSSTSNAKQAYANFLDLEKGAAADLPLSKHAQAEAAQFH
ncbi:MAG TPA: hypothetical protein VFI38_11330 [Candidatus Acidoferrum sp.]|nr:hypothetical protein [Candidatus Acidoferrum sp.]